MNTHEIEKRFYLQEELEEYERQTSMTSAERKCLYEWVRSGHSVYENESTDPYDERDFLEVFREKISH